MTRPHDMSDAKPLRLFVAVELPGSVKLALEDAIAALKRAGADESLRWVRPDGIHLTLKFLGATPLGRVPAIVDALREHLRGAQPFDLQPEGFGAFHGGKKAATFRTWWHEAYAHNIRVIFVGLRGDVDALSTLAECVETAISPLGFPREKHPERLMPKTFFGHLTLARVREDSTREQRERVSAVMGRFQHAADAYTGPPEITVDFPPFRVDRVALIQSTLQPGGAVYRAVETFALGEQAG